MASSSSSSRTLTALEIALHRVILSCTNETANQADIESVEATKDQRQDAINTLLAAGMIKLLREEGSNRVLYRAVKVKEAKSKSNMDRDTQAVFAQIEEAKSEGVWTKAIQRRTDLPQKVVAKCIKTLEQQSLIKPVKSVKYPTRKMYMLYNLTPSVEITGGVWYTDNEFDTPFVNILLDHIYGYIANRTLPPKTASCQRPLYSVSERRKFPDVNKIANWLERTGISEVILSTDDVQLLLNVLEYDGRIEKIPGGGALFLMESDEDDTNFPAKKKRKRVDSTDEESAYNGEKKRLKLEDTDEGEDTDNDYIVVKKKTARGTNKDTKRSSKALKGKSVAAQDEDDSSFYSKFGHVQLDAETAFVYRAIRPSEAQEKPSFPASLFGGSWLAGPSHGSDIQHLGALPWAEAPCVRCPQVDFCLEGGPVNASGCEYLDSWLDPVRASKTVTAENGGHTEAKLSIEVDA